MAFVLCNLDRVNMSIAILPMAQQYGWSTATMGLVQSSFFWWVVGPRGLVFRIKVRARKAVLWGFGGGIRGPPSVALFMVLNSGV